MSYNKRNSFLSAIKSNYKKVSTDCDASMDSVSGGDYCDRSLRSNHNYSELSSRNSSRMSHSLLASNSSTPIPLLSRSLSSALHPIISLNFHALHGSDIVISSDMTEASRIESAKTGPEWHTSAVNTRNNCNTNAYAFLTKCVSIGQIITIKISSLHEMTSNGNQCLTSFIFGVTNIDPNMLSFTDLPNNAQQFIYRLGEYWALVDQFCDYCSLWDELSFMIDSNGCVRFAINSNQFNTTLFQTNRLNENLWPFFNIVGRIRAIKLVQSKPHSQAFNQLQTNLESHLFQCIYCFANKANVAFYKCGHKYFCMRCAIYMKHKLSNKCPFCFQIIHDLIRIFP